jgi:hypothetical protein
VEKDKGVLDILPEVKLTFASGIIVADFIG